ncbi:AAA family ATPase [Paenibacillus sp. OK076]|uniref:AAA family ATPase n=1 Tax=Paenibacillus sp. OK076 TaxID=1884379 RepID=UPI0008B810ED|nr:AAA family ATPase [Paenibacillus sp. OK076]SEO99913.1 Predicted ATPase [Paenibacillus sp. OK076]
MTGINIIKHATEDRDSGKEGLPLDRIRNDAPKITLKEFIEHYSPMKLEVFLPLARAIVSCVGNVHRLQTLHLDLRPEHIDVLNNGYEVSLNTSGCTVLRSAEGYIRPHPIESGIPEGSLPYCSPENTGRMQRQIDERSDLYSLGAIFYEMLTGRLPFLANTALEWVYLHLAQSPSPLNLSGIHGSDALESIVMKLLEKNPDSRYPNTAYLLADLDRIGQSADTLLTESDFHGRLHEMSVLIQAFDSACLGSTEMMYVAGEAGMGKTSLIHQVFRNEQHARPFFYITGKFEQLSMESPYQPIIQAFRGLIRHLLGETKQASMQWGHKLREALGIYAGVITSIIPEADMILGQVPAVEELPANESKKRFVHAFRKFVQTLATRECPLVLFIDDVQWADSSSLQLIDALLCDPESQYLMIVCAYRQAETDVSQLPGYQADGSAALQAVIRHIHLSPLGLEDMNGIVTAKLNSDTHATQSLTELLYQQSGGNPFHFQQILLRLQDDQTLLYDEEHRHWQWDLGQIIEHNLSYSVQDLITLKLRRLNEEAQELLQVAACVGSTFHSKFIALVVNQHAEVLLPLWSMIVAEGMIMPTSDQQFKFAHDHIQKQIYSSMDVTSRQALHLRIGSCLRDLYPENEEHTYEKVHHLNRGSASIADPQEILRLVQLNADAGHRAKSASAHDVALGYFRQAIELLPAGYWEMAFETCFELHIQRAECEYLCGHHAQSEQEIELLLERARNPVERSKVQMIRIMQYINQGKYSEGTALGLECLHDLRISITPNPGKFTLFIESKRIEWMLQNRYEQLTHLEEMQDQERISAMNLIFAITPSTFFTNKKVFFLLMCRAIQLSLQYGNTPVSAAVYSAYGLLQGIALGKFERGYAMGKVGMELSNRYNIPSIQSRTYTMFGGVLCQFVGDAREGDMYLEDAIQMGMNSGDYIFASYAIGAHVNSLYTRAPLGQFSKNLADYLTVLETTKDEFVRQNIYLYQQYILALQGKTDAPDSFSRAHFDENEFLERISGEETSGTTLFQYNTYKTQLCYLLGHYEEAMQWARQARSHKIYATHLPHLPECLFYESLAMVAACIQPHQRSTWPTLKRRFNQNIRRFRQWAAWSPVNYQSRLLLLEAELARVSRDMQRAEHLYDQCIREARERGDLRVASLASEIAATHYENQGKRKSASFYLQSSIQGYEQWEVRIKVTQLKKLQQHWHQEQEPEHASHTSLPPSDSSDKMEKMEQSMRSASFPDQLAAIDRLGLSPLLQTMQDTSSQTEMDTVVADIMKSILIYAGASKGALLTGSAEPFFIQGYSDMESSSASSNENIHDMNRLPEGIIRYVFRTQERVYYNGGEDSWLIHNPYMSKHQPQSVLCIPVAVHGTLLGVLYLENRLTRGVFHEEQNSVLVTMASHVILMGLLHHSHETSDPSQSSQDIAKGTDSLSTLIEEPLTERELEVLALIAAGLSNKEIAEHLVIAMGTVKVHVKHIFAKLKVNRRTKAIAQAKELNLLE